jgi:alpha-tubulin suppressor-like RCC1 family protein
MTKTIGNPHRSLGAIAAALALACGGSDGNDGKNGASALVVTAAEPPGANCAAGGTVVRAGVDRDGDGTLEAGEVSSTAYLCNGSRGDDGQDGARSLVDAVEVTDGSCGAPGGKIVRWGLDDLVPNGALDAGEVDGSTKLCNGAVGTRVLASAAPWGGACERGGVKIDSWVDVDGDGTVNGAETLLAPQYVCNVYTTAISAGTQQTCSRMSDGTVRCAGFVGGTNTSAPVTIPGISSATAVASGFAHACAILADLGVVCWGDNTFGQLGTTAVESSATPLPIPGIADAQAIDAKGDHTCVVRSGGTVACWGDNFGGVLGADPIETAQSAAPVEIAAWPVELPGFFAVDVAVGVQHACARGADQTVACWGLNTAGQLGVDPATTPEGFSVVPVAVALASATVPATPFEPSLAVAAGNDFTCSVGATTNNVVCWGSTADDRLGFTAVDPFSIGADVAAIFAGAVDVAAGADHACAVMDDASVWCWGANGVGQLGLGGVGPVGAPQVVPGLAGVAAVTGGDGYGCALGLDGSAACWGVNGNGQLGTGSFSPSLVPAPVVGGLAP